MNDQSLMLLGMVKMKHPNSNHFELVEVKGFDVVGFFFAPIRVIFGETPTKLKALFLFTFFAVPIWAWYMGFNYKKIKFETMLKDGWTIDNGNSDKKVA